MKLNNRRLGDYVILTELKMFTSLKRFFSMHKCMIDKFIRALHHN